MAQEFGTDPTSIFSKLIMFVVWYGLINFRVCVVDKMGEQESVIKFEFNSR